MSILVPDPSDVTMTATGQLMHLCPHKDEVDTGTVTITWRVGGSTFELHTLRQYLSGFRHSTLSHEQITDRIRHDLSVEGLDLISVETNWVTADMEVLCSTSPIPAGKL